MILTNMQISDFIMDELKKVGRLHFRGDDLYKTFLAGKEIELRVPPEEFLPSEFVDLDYKYFKEEFLNYLRKHDIPSIVLEDDSLDIFTSKIIRNDFLKAYQLQDEINRLDILIVDPRTTEEEEMELLARQIGLIEEKDTILAKYE